MMPSIESERIDVLMEDLRLAEERVVSLQQDREIYLEMVQILLRQLNTELELNERLMWRIRNGR